MTTTRFNQMASPQALALNAIKTVHCQPPAYKPTKDSSGSTPCTFKGCRGMIKFKVRASDGGTSGRCSSAGCLTWTE